MWRTLALLCVLASTSLTTTHHAQACSCMPPGSDEDEAKKADAVFIGTVTSITTTQDRSSLAQIAVETATKGVRAGTTVTIDAGMGGGMCGFQFERGKRYKVFAYKNAQGVLRTSICSATRAV